MKYNGETLTTTVKQLVKELLVFGLIRTYVESNDRPDSDKSNDSQDPLVKFTNGLYTYMIKLSFNDFWANNSGWINNGLESHKDLLKENYPGAKRKLEAFLLKSSEENLSNFTPEEIKKYKALVKVLELHKSMQTYRTNKFAKEAHENSINRLIDADSAELSEDGKEIETKIWNNDFKWPLKKISEKHSENDGSETHTLINFFKMRVPQEIGRALKSEKTSNSSVSSN